MDLPSDLFSIAGIHVESGISEDQKNLASAGVLIS